MKKKCFGSFTGIDLALLSQANHSIVSYGTFGVWGAFLAGGLITAPKSHTIDGALQIMIDANLTNVQFL